MLKVELLLEYDIGGEEYAPHAYASHGLGMVTARPASRMPAIIPGFDPGGKRSLSTTEYI